MLNASILGRAQEKGLIEHPRPPDPGLYHQQAEPGGRLPLRRRPRRDHAVLTRCGAAGCAICDEIGAPVHTVFLSPCGPSFDQAKARQLQADYDNLILVCGHYEGVDQRFLDECVDEEISMGDFVLTGGEIPAMAIVDAVSRLIPGVLGDEVCFTDESHWSGLLEYPQYSRPDDWHGLTVPEVLRSGNHAKVARWQQKAVDPAHAAPAAGSVLQAALPVQDAGRAQIYRRTGGRG